MAFPKNQRLLVLYVKAFLVSIFAGPGSPGCQPRRSNDRTSERSHLGGAIQIHAVTALREGSLREAVPIAVTVLSVPSVRRPSRPRRAATVPTLRRPSRPYRPCADRPDPTVRPVRACYERPDRTVRRAPRPCRHVSWRVAGEGRCLGR